MAEADTSPQVIAKPPRFWWLKRIVLAMLLLAGLLVALRYVSLHVAKRRLEAEINAIRARGEPLAPEDFLDRPVAAEDDAGPDLVAAGRTFAVPKQHVLSWNIINTRPYTYRPQDAATLEAIFTANQQALAKVRSARGKRVVNWQLAMNMPARAIPYHRLWELRQVSEALQIAAKKAITEGRQHEAVEYLRDCLMLSRSLETQPALISHLVGYGIQGNVSYIIMTIAPALRVGDGDGPASEAQVRALMQELLDDHEELRRGRKWAWQSERMMQMDLVYGLASEDEATRAAMHLNFYSRFVTWWMQPSMTANGGDLLGRANVYVRAAGAPDMPQAAQILREWENRSSRNWYLSRPGSPMDGNLNSQFQTVYVRRQAAVALAAALFHLKYGRDAKDIHELVPEFLPQAPLDPLMGNGKTMMVHPIGPPGRR
jgi:hypothetical protein